MTLTPEQQVILASAMAARQPGLPEGKPEAGFTPAELEEYGDYYFGMYRQDWTGAFDRLTVNGLLSKNDGQFAITPAGMNQANALQPEHSRQLYAYNEYFSRAKTSAAHAKFCERVYGQDLCQHGMMDIDQLENLGYILRATGARQVLELGCGNGAAAVYLADCTEAYITGVDLSPVGIDWAKELAQGKEDHLEFFAADMKTLEFEPNSFNAIVLVDAIYFVPDTAAFTQKLLGWLRPSGKLYVFYSSWTDDEAERSSMLPHKTKFARMLQESGLAYQMIDYTHEEIEHWKTKLAVAEEMKEEFEKEGNGWLGHRRWIEAKQHSVYVDKGLVSRYLYIVDSPILERIDTL